MVSLLPAMVICFTTGPKAPKPVPHGLVQESLSRHKPLLFISRLPQESLTATKSWPTAWQAESWNKRSAKGKSTTHRRKMPWLWLVVELPGFLLWNPPPCSVGSYRKLFTRSVPISLPTDLLLKLRWWNLGHSGQLKPPVGKSEISIGLVVWEAHFCFNSYCKMILLFGLDFMTL